MRIAAVSDIHYSRETKAAVGQLARRISQWNPDVLAILGDVVDIQKDDDFGRALALFRKIGSLRLFVPGNHDIFTLQDDPLRLYHELDKRAHLAGFRFLPKAGVVKGTLGFVGTLGWYDYTLIPSMSAAQGARFVIDGKTKSWDELTTSDFAKKMVWIRTGGRNLKEIMETLPPEDLMALQIARRHAKVDIVELMNRRLHFLSDLKFVKKAVSDEAFCTTLREEFIGQLRHVTRHASRLITMSHMVPFREGVAAPSGFKRDFFSAYKGSARLGESLVSQEKVFIHLHGHHHEAGSPLRYRVGAISVKNVAFPLTGDFTRIVLR